MESTYMYIDVDVHLFPWNQDFCGFLLEIEIFDNQNSFNLMYNKNVINYLAFGPYFVIHLLKNRIIKFF